MTINRFAYCEYCGRRVEMTGVRLPPQWFTLSQRAQDAIGPDDEHHFCSIPCVENWCGDHRPAPD